MHYYKRNIGEYHKKAGRLSMLQHGAYTLLIDACYDREIFPTKEEAIDWCWAITEEEIAAVELVLRKFFIEIDGVYEQRHIREDLDKYHENAKINKRIAIEREENRRTKRERSVNEAPPNHKPRTNNHKPRTSINNITLEKFDGFWAIYPKKADKKKSKEIWKRRKLDSLAEIIISDVENRLANDRKWKEGYIPNPTTYLNGDRWEDEIEVCNGFKPKSLAERMEDYEGKSPFDIIGDDGSIVSEQ